MTEPVDGGPATDDDSLDIAVVGMACRFPNAPDVATFWRNLRDGACAVSPVSDERLAAAGLDSAVTADERFVRAAATLEAADEFDAEFFGFSPREAELMDPQHRVLLEGAWEALEHAGIDVERHPGLIGVYAGVGMNGYLVLNLASRRDLIDAVGTKQVEIGNSGDFAATRISYKLGLEGPSVNVQSACSTSLVAVAMACQGLLAYQCDVALAGGAAIDLLHGSGYLYQDDGVLSPDGLCRAFDAGARGTVVGSGVGLVVLKRVQDAITDGDHIHALIRGSAVNNDGSHRVGFTAPRQDGQAMVIATALAAAGVSPASVQFVEAHGTGTTMGDPIEVAALNAAFAPQDGTRRDGGQGLCYLGSVKTNIGHLDVAAGVAGLIKTVLAVEHGLIPPTLHYREPNPRIDFAAGPFRVNTELVPWPATDGPRRAGVSAFGLGGTNAHVVLQEAPPRAPSPAPAGREQLVVLSARSPHALETMSDRLAAHLRQHPDLSPADVAYTLQVGRAAMPHRRVFVGSSLEDIGVTLETRDAARLLSGTGPSLGTRRAALLFTGFGDQYPGMARQLYEQEAVFREALDTCAALADEYLERKLLDVLFDAPGPVAQPRSLRQTLLQPEPDEHPLHSATYGYPATFAVEYASACLWRSWGVAPAAMIGHSLGEYVAACVAGVFSLPDAMMLVVRRAQLIEALPEGAMLAVPLAEPEVARYLGEHLSLAAVNTPRTCVLSGSPEAVAAVAEDLEARGVACRRLGTRRAFHSHMLDPIVGPYEELVRSVPLHPPTIPFVSNVSGDWITADEATDPNYWARHMRLPVRFADGVGRLWAAPDLVLLEVGPGQTLSSTALQCAPVGDGANRVALSSVRSSSTRATDRAFLLRAVGQLWLAGVPVAWDALHRAAPPRRVPLPAYPFERRRFWIDPRPGASSAPPPAATRRPDPASWISVPSWVRLPRLGDLDPVAGGQRWMVFADDLGVGERIVARLRASGASVSVVRPGERWRELDDGFAIDPADPEHYRRLAERLRVDGGLPARLVHCWSLGADDAAVDDLLLRGFRSLVLLAQACASELMVEQPRWDVISNGVYSVTGDEPLTPSKAAVQGFCRVAGQEYPGMRCKHVDVVLDAASDAGRVADQLMLELMTQDEHRLVALRGSGRWAQHLSGPAVVPADGTPLREHGVYLITGGLGRIGLVVARWLASAARARLVLVGRNVPPPRTQWQDTSHPESVARTIAAVQDLEALGAEVLLCRADVADEGALRGVVAQAEARFGGIDGVFHSAGSVGAQAHRLLAETAPADGELHFAAKLRGAYALRAALQGRHPDFVLLFSSVAAILGGLGFGAYAAANACLDAVATACRQAGEPWTSVNWEAWQFAGAEAASGAGPIGATIQGNALDETDGRAVLSLLLGLPGEPQIIVSTTDVADRARRWADPTHADSTTAPERYARPRLRNPYVAPGNELEQRIADVWAGILGVDEVGIHDNFFELGGNSLLGLQVVHEIRRGLRLAVPLTLVYEGPTVATMAKLLSDDAEAAGDTHGTGDGR